MEIIPFDFNNYKIRTFTDENGNIWFIAQDISKVLEIKNISDAVKDFDEDEKGVFKMKTSGGSQKMLIINESRAQKIISRSRKMSGDKKKRLLKVLGIDTNVLVLKSNKEVEFGELLIDVIKGFDSDIVVLKQFNIKNYNLDFYLPDYNLVIEFDEANHEYRKEEDLKREAVIQHILKCKIIRVKEKTTGYGRDIGFILRNLAGF